jgi:lysophospholipase L1-like esterase
MNKYLLSLMMVPLAGSCGHAEEGPVILSMDEMKYSAPKGQAAAEFVDGKFGKAIKFTFDKEAKSGFFTTNTRANAEWDQAAGFSFWVRGYGTDGFCGLEFIHGDDFGLRYDYCFPIRGTAWTKITVAWRDLVPVLPKGNLLDPAGEFKPSKLAGPWVGRWWYWYDYPAVSFAIDQVRLEKHIDVKKQEDKPAGDPLVHVRTKVKAGQPITIVTMGDSLTDYHHWANRKASWPTLLRDRLKEKHKVDVTIVNPAIGGTELRQNLVLIPRWVAQTPEPDLVTICFGGNDWNSGMRGAMFNASCTDAVDRVRRATRGKADLLLLTTVPGVERWSTYAELSEAVRTTAKNRNTGIADAEAAFHAAGKDDKARLFVSDKVHLGLPGHELMAECVLQAIEMEPKAPADKK